MCLWWGWKWRCGVVFGSFDRCRDRVEFVKEKSKEITAAYNSLALQTNSRTNVTRFIKWVSLRAGWYKVNIDGPCHGNPGRATTDGVSCDENGTWIGGFTLNIGVCSAPLAELWSVYYGLYMAWDKRLAKLELEVNSKMLVEFLTTRSGDNHPLSFIIRLCYDFISRDWCVCISHVYREANRLANVLANYAFSLPLDFHLLDIRPNCVALIALDDDHEIGLPRMIQM